MTDERQIGDDQQASLRALLAETGQAHHDEVGPVDDDWATWYAGHLEGKLDEFVGFSPDLETIRSWLIAADERYLATESPGEPWPAAYARFILDDHAPSDAR